jgi:hypothetical protein
MLAVLAAGVAQAQQPAGEATACAAIREAFQAVAETERFQTRLVARTPTARFPTVEQRIVLGDVVFATSPGAGRWIRMPMTAEGRASLAAALGTFPPRDCRDEGAKDLDGTATRLYSYRQVLPDAGADGMVMAQVWIAATDGRPRRYQSRRGDLSIEMTYAYDDVAAPFGR